MEKDFHHHLVYALAKVVGFNKKIEGSDETEAEIIAYASQYVDDNCDREYSVSHNNENYPIVLPNKIETKNGRYYYPLITQAVNIKSLDLKIQNYVFMPFHFLPGDYKTLNINDLTNPYCTTKNSASANKVLDEALKSEDSYRIGIAFHTYADTWSHQRFTAFNEPWNKVLEWYKDFKALAPDIGHADVWHLPDQICKTWRDHRFDESSVVNKDRTFEALEKIYKKLYQQRKDTSWADIKDEIAKIIYLDTMDDSDEKKVYDERKKRIESFIGELLSYDRDKWIADAVEFELEEADEDDPHDPLGIHGKKLVPTDIHLKDNFEGSHWYKFQVAAKVQLSEVLKLTANL
jgi:hypothetical protein